MVYYIKRVFLCGAGHCCSHGGKDALVQNKDSGKMIKIGMDGSYEIMASGLRTPNGIGLGVDEEIFVADNQGDWLPACKILHMKKGAFYGSYSTDLYIIGKYVESPLWCGFLKEKLAILHRSLVF